MNELHLFAGAGGGILGGQLLGHTCVCAVEIEAYCRSVLLQRQRDKILPWFPIWDDVRTFDGNPWRGLVDVVCGGFPCQDISFAGKGEGIEGEKSGLWFEMFRIIRETDPRFVWVENVAALTFRGLGIVLRDLASMGYNAKWGVLGGFHAGGISNGPRIWILAFKADCSMLESLDLSESVVACSEESCRREFTRTVGAMLSQDDYAAVKRDAAYVARGMERLKAIGNGQNPIVAATAWEILK